MRGGGLKKSGEEGLERGRLGLGKEKKRGERGRAVVAMPRELDFVTKGFLEGRTLASMAGYK